MHWAIHGHTAAELISKRADANKPNMGLTVWKGGVVQKGDVGIAKNYLTEKEISDLNLIVNQYPDVAEFQARRHQPMRARIRAHSCLLEDEELKCPHLCARFFHYSAFDHPGDGVKNSGTANAPRRGITDGLIIHLKCIGIDPDVFDCTRRSPHTEFYPNLMDNGTTWSFLDISWVRPSLHSPHLARSSSSLSIS